MWKNRIKDCLAKKSPNYCLFLHKKKLPLQLNNEEDYNLVCPASPVDCL